MRDPTTWIAIGTSSCLAIKEMPCRRRSGARKNLKGGSQQSEVRLLICDRPLKHLLPPLTWILPFPYKQARLLGNCVCGCRCTDAGGNIIWGPKACTCVSVPTADFETHSASSSGPGVEQKKFSSLRTSMHELRVTACTTGTSTPVDVTAENEAMSHCGVVYSLI